MAKALEAHAYLAGPDVFLPNAVAIGRAKKKALERVGIIGHFPFDNEIPASAASDPSKAARLIAKANERMMMACCRQGYIGIILANMMPFYGPSMDVGTAFEVGFMSALAATNPNVVIIGYTDDPRPFEERVIEMVYGGRKNVYKRNGKLYGPDGKLIETFGCADNLMIAHAVEKTKGTIVLSFDEAIVAARKAVDARRASHEAQKLKASAALSQQGATGLPWHGGRNQRERYTNPGSK